MPKDEWLAARNKDWAAQVLAEYARKQEAIEIGRMISARSQLSTAPTTTGGPAMGQAPLLVKCPECECEVRSDRLTKHLRKSHRIERPYSETRKTVISAATPEEHTAIRRALQDSQEELLKLSIEMSKIKEMLNRVRARLLILAEVADKYSPEPHQGPLHADRGRASFGVSASDNASESSSSGR